MKPSLFIWSIAAALCAVEAQAAPPARVEIAYQLLRNGMHVADVSTRLEHDGKSYTLTETWKTRGIFALLGDAKRSSRGSVSDGGLRSDAFLDERRGSVWGEALFDWRVRTLTMRHKGKSRVEPLTEPVQDRLSVFFGFAFAFPVSSSFTLFTTDGRGVSKDVYDLSGRGPVTTPAGEFTALRLVKRKDAPGDRSIEIWLAADRHLLPLRVVFVEKDGERLEQIATHLSLAPSP